MSNLSHSSPRVLFFGTPGQFSRAVLLELARNAVHVVGIVHRTTPDAPTAVTTLVPRSTNTPPVAGVARSHLDTIPRILVRDLDDPQVVDHFSTFRADVIVAGCFPLLIPRSIREISVRPALNVHPSLLPRHRGPDPIFWTLHAGETAAGVTIHAMDDQFDTGPIFAQSQLDIDPDATYARVEGDLAILGGSPLADLVCSTDWPDPMPQQAISASHEPRPEHADLVITREWSADRARRFIAGCGYSHGPLTYRSDSGADVQFRTLADYREGARIELEDGVLYVRPIT